MYMESSMSEQEKRGAGRPSVNNDEIIRGVLAKPETRNVLIGQIQKLVKQRKEILSKQEFYKGDVKSTKESFGLSGGYVTGLVEAIVKDEVDKKVKESTLMCDLLSLFSAPADGEGVEDEPDEDFEE